MPMVAIDFCKVDVVGSTPTRSTAKQANDNHDYLKQQKDKSAEDETTFAAAIERTEGSRIRLAGTHC